LPAVKFSLYEVDVIFLKTITFIIASLIILGIITDNNFYLTVTDRFRYIGVFKNPNFIALFAFLGFAISFKLFKEYKQKKFLYLLIMYSLLIFLTNSRTAIFSHIILVIIYYYFSFYEKNTNKSKRIIFSIVFLIFLISITYLLLFIDYEFLNELLSLRPQIWLRNFRLLSLEEIIFGKIYSNSILYGSVSYDNFYFNQFMQFGFLGLFFFFITLTVIFLKLLKIVNKNNRKFILSFFITWIVYNIFESFFISIGNIVSIYFWTILGFHINLNND